MSQEPKYTPTEARIGRAYMLELLVAMVGYAVTLVGALLWLRTEPEGVARWGVALLPMAGVLLVVRAVGGFFRKMDEFLRLRLLEVLGLSFTGSAILVLTLGFLELGGLRLPSVWWVWIGMGAIWILSHFAVHLRAR